MVWLFAVILAGTLDATGTRTGADARGAPTIAPIPAAEGAVGLLRLESRRIRTAHERIMRVLEEGARRSPTFAALLRKVHDSTVIVYIEPTFALPPDMAARVVLQAAAGHQRYLRMQVRATLQGEHLIATIAHELGHVLEVAGDPSVLDEAGLRALYRRIGHSSHGADGYDTEGAKVIGRIVRKELIG